MCLWILSQDEMMLVPITNKGLWIDDSMTYLDEDTRNPDKNFEIWCDDNILGEYDTLERAKEVLREIYDMVSIKYEIQGTYQDLDIDVKARILANMSRTYEMPKE